MEYTGMENLVGLLRWAWLGMQHLEFCGVKILGKVLALKPASHDQTVRFFSNIHCLYNIIYPLQQVITKCVVEEGVWQDGVGVSFCSGLNIIQYSKLFNLYYSTWQGCPLRLLVFAFPAWMLWSGLLDKSLKKNKCMYLVVSVPCHYKTPFKTY